MPVDRSTWELLHRLQIGAELADALPAGLYGKPTLTAFVRALGHGCQLLEDRITGRHLALTLDGASGADLDIMGRLVGELREGLGDALYRRFIAARMLANKSEGTPDQLARILSLAGEGPAWCFNFPTGCAFHLYIGRPAPLPAEVVGRLARLLRAVQPAGVGMLAVEIVTGDLGDRSTDLDVSPDDLGSIMARQLYPPA